jgi:hypothetical protein
LPRSGFSGGAQGFVKKARAYSGEVDANKNMRQQMNRERSPIPQERNAL